MSVSRPAPRVSVGLPTFNGARHLAAAISAVLAQDMPDFELLIADNASTDGTLAIAEAAAAMDPRVRVLRSASNRGAAWNYNRLVHHARGEFFKWASDDDLIAPTYLSACLAVLEARPAVVLAYAATTLIADDGRSLGPHRDGLDLVQPSVSERMRQFAASRHLCNPCFGVARTQVLRQRTALIGPHPSSDITFLAQVALAGQIAEVPERLFFRRVDTASASLGGHGTSAAAHFFDPRARASFVPPLARVFVDIERAIGTSPEPRSERARTAVVFAVAWAKRQAGIVRWRVARRVRGEGRRGFAASVLERPSVIRAGAGAGAARQARP